LSYGKFEIALGDCAGSELYVAVLETSEGDSAEIHNHFYQLNRDERLDGGLGCDYLVQVGMALQRIPDVIWQEVYDFQELC